MSFDSRVSDGIAEVVLNHPPVNALDSHGWNELARCIAAHGQDSSVRVVVIAAEGRGFCAGVDIKELAADSAAITSVNRGCYDTFAAIYDCAVPVLSAVHGFCLGGGIGIAGSSDVVIASDDATFGLPEVTRGIIPGAGGTQRLPRLIGPERALDLILTGRRIDAREAERIGLVSRVVPSDDLRAEALTVANAIAENGPLAVRAAKAAVWRGLDVPLDEGLRLEQLLAEPVRQSEDAQEGPRAFIEKRKPEFKGR